MIPKMEPRIPDSLSDSFRKFEILGSLIGIILGSGLGSVLVPKLFSVDIEVEISPM